MLSIDGVVHLMHALVPLRAELSIQNAAAHFLIQRRTRAGICSADLGTVILQRFGQGYAGATVAHALSSALARHASLLSKAGVSLL